jgi:Cu+-exporting ATPase
MLNRIIRLVEDAQTNKAPVQRFADKISAIFVPVILAIAAVTFAFWYIMVVANVIPAEWTEKEGDVLFALLFAVSVLVIACPCALGLAVPTAVMVGTGVGASLGVLIKGGSALELGSQVQTVCFDKTGTLTTGKPTVTDVHVVDQTAGRGSTGLTKRRRLWILRVLAAAESGSEHPLAGAVLRYVDEQLELEKTAADGDSDGDSDGDDGGGGYGDVAEAQDFEAVPGRGVSCTVGKHSVLIGNRSLLTGAGVSLPEPVEQRMRAQESQGCTVVTMAIDGQLVVTVAISDQLKPVAAAAVAGLKRMGLDVWLITGDNRRCARTIGQLAGIGPENILAEVLPGEKADQIATLQRDGRCSVAMVGDGINDAPALARADLGVAIGCGSDVAIETADAVLVKDDLRDVVVAIHLSRAVFSRIKLNFVWVRSRADFDQNCCRQLRFVATL